MLVRAWPQGRPRILVTDAWLANAGDGAISLATERRLRRLAPDAAIVHAAYQGDLLAHAYPELRLVPPLAGLVGVTPTIPEMRRWGAKAAEQIIGPADLVLSQGGGFAMEHYDPWERLRAWELVVERGVPIAFCAQSVGPFRRPRERAILERVYGAAVAIGLRERHSEANVLDLGADPARVFVTADEAFSLIEADAVRGSPGRGIACVLSGHPWLHASGSVVEPDRAADALSRMLADLVELSAGEHVTLLSTQQGLGATRRGLEDDAEVAQRAVAALPDDLAQAVRTVPGYLAPMQCADVVASHRGLLSMRMHPAIFGLCLGVPTVLVTEAFKVTAMFDALGLGSTVFSWADRSAAVERLRDEPAVPPRRLETARRRAGGNDAVVQRLLDAALYRSSRS